MAMENYSTRLSQSQSTPKTENAIGIVVTNDVSAHPSTTW